MQELFLKVYRNRDRIHEEYANRYLNRATANLAKDYLKRKRPVIRQMREPRSREPSPLAQAIKNEALQRAKRAFQHLSIEDQELLTERYAGDASTRENARRQGIPYSTLRTRQEAAVRKLRTLYKVNYFKPRANQTPTT